MLPSIDKIFRNPVTPKGEQVRKIDPTDKLHPRDYAFEMDRVGDQDDKHPQQQKFDFGKDTFESSDEKEEQPTSDEKPYSPETNRTTDHDQNIDIKI